MSRIDSDRSFAGSIPEIYEHYLVPLIFEPYAKDLAARVAASRPKRVLEIAAGTGVVTRQLARLLPEATIVATDLNQPMLDEAAAIQTSGRIEWRQADAMDLPFDDQSFDAIVCQFGVMFFPDKPHAYAEARRVLRPGGRFVFNVWDGIEQNDFARAVTDALADLFPDAPPRFMARVPHGYHDTAVIAHDLEKAGFDNPVSIISVVATSLASSSTIAAIAFCHGTPLRNEIEALGSHRLAEATDRAATAIAKRFGAGAISGKVQALVMVVER